MAQNSKLTVLEQLFRSKNIYAVLHTFKAFPFSESTKKIKQALKHPLASKTIFHGGSLPKSYSQLRETKTMPNSGYLEGELAWYVQSLSKFSALINKFIEIEILFERDILLDNYDAALSNLNRIEEEICKSYWGIENRFSTIQNKSGDEANWALLKELNSQTKGYYTLFFNATFSKKAESEITLLQYKRGIEAEMNSLFVSDSEYLLFKLGYFFVDDYSEYAYIVNSENSSSVIDKYSTLIDIILELSNSTDHSELAKNVIFELESIGINDFRLNRLKELNCIPTNLDLNTDLISLFDIYTMGNYRDAHKTAVELLKKHPECIEVYEILIKSLIELKEPFIKTNVSNFIDNILKNLFSIFTRDTEYYTSRENLLKIYLTYPRINFFKRLLGLVSNLTGIKSTKDILSNNINVFSSYSNPSIILTKRKLKDYYNNSDSIKNFLSYKINHSIATNNFDEIKDYDLPENKSDLYRARGSFINEDYPSTITILERMLSGSDLKNYVEEEVIYLLFNAYLIENNYDKAVKLMVDSYFKNKFYIERLIDSPLYNIIIKNDYNISPSINLPIFFYLNNASSYQKYVSLEIYLDTISCAKPSDIDIDGMDEAMIQKYIFLLDKICDLKVLNYFYSVFMDDNEVLDERKEVLRKLIAIDKPKSTIFLEELASITQKEKIKSIIQAVNDGIIRLNFSRIKDNKDINLENNFNRFIKFSEFAQKNNLTVVDTHVLIENYLSELTSDSSKLQDASFVLFKSVFFEVVEHFLFSEEHGLDGDISTRIRHGVLENQIRKIFLNTNLIALKNKEGIYQDIHYWNEYGEKEGYLKDVITKFQDLLKKFSKSIDDKIDFIVNEQMQIHSNRYSKKKNGLFNYYYPEEYLWIVFKETTKSVKDYDEFLNFSFDLIKEYTDALLFNIREYLRVTVNTEFNSFLEELEADVRKIYPMQSDIFSELFQIINNTKVMIQKELDIISEWFKVSNPLLDSTLDVKTIIETSVESTNLLNTKNKVIHANINVADGILFQSFDYYIVIFGILFENIIKHSGIETPDIYVDISVSYEVVKIEGKDYVSFTLDVSNEICDLNEQKLVEIFEDIKSNWRNKLINVNTEGGSGFKKIKRILKYDIKSLDSDFSYKIADSHLTISLKILLYNKIIDNE